jgi:poly(3-hydroxybutyrate) depolymerase
MLASLAVAVLAAASTATVRADAGSVLRGPQVLPNAFTATNETLTIQDPGLGAVNRTFSLTSPPPSSGAASGIDALLVVFHGQGGTSAAARAEHSFDALAAASGRFVVAYPQGMGDGTQGTGWNVGTAGDDSTCLPGTTATDCYDSCRALGRCGRCNWSTCHDDVAFVRSLVAAVERRFPGIERRFVVGGSNGGMMIHWLLAQWPGAFDGAVPVFGTPLLGYLAGGKGAPLLRSAQASRRTAILSLHDRSDTVVPWQGGRDSDGWLYETLERTMDVWAAVHGCGADASPVSTPLSGGSAKVACTAYPDCGSGVVQQCLYDGTHGTWPEQPRGDDAVWSFFQGLVE